MPKETFLNLPKGKKEKLIKAIRSEIEETPFEKVSINKIVQRAEIPRGSFYQYFEDKYDMLGFILSESVNTMFEKMYDTLVKNNGDIFKMFYEMLDFITSFAKTEENKRFCKNLFTDIKVNTLICKKAVKCKGESKNILKLREKVNMSLLDIRSEKDFENMIKILLSIFRDATAETFMNIGECEKCKEEFRLRLELIKRGFQNKESEADA